MPTVIDSFVIELGLDPKQFTAGQRELMDNLRKMQEQSEKGGKEIESQGKKFGDVFNQMKREVIGATAIFLGGRGVKEFVGHITSLDAATGRVAYTMNVSARELSAWQGAVRQNGGSAEAATGALAGLSGEMNKFMLTGQTSMLPVLSTLDISLFDVNRNLKTSDQLLRDLNERVHKMDPARAAALLSMVPGMNQDMMNLLLKSPEALNKFIDASKRAGTTTKESAEAAAAYQRQLSLLDQTASNTGRNILQYFIPAMVEGMRLVGRFFETLNNPKKPEEVQKEVEATRGKLVKKFGDPRDYLNYATDAWNDSFLAGVFGRSAKMGDFFYGAGAPGAPTSTATTPAGLPVKPGAGRASPETEAAMRALAGLPGVNRVTSLNDPFHALLGGAHPAGRALDLTVKDPAQSAAVADAIRARLAAAGISATVLDEYKNPSRNSTAPHIHVTVLPTLPRGPTVGAAAAADRGDDNRRTSVTNVTMNVVLPGVKNADDFARDIKPVMERGNGAASFNSALR